MNKVLRKRLLRDLRANSGRCLALFLLFVMGIYLVISIVGSSEMIIRGTERQKAVNMVEDGQFTVFLPLTEDDLSRLTVDRHRTDLFIRPQNRRKCSLAAVPQQRQNRPDPA